MAELTKEWLRNTIASIESEQDEIPFGPAEEQIKILTVFKIALASLEAGPVTWQCGENIILFNSDTLEAYAKRVEISPKPLCRALPVPVVPDEGREQFEALIRFHASDKSHETLLLRANEGMNYQEPNVDLAWIFWKSSREHLLQGKGENLPEFGKQVRELTMLVKRLACSLKSVSKSSKLPDKAMEYLKQNGLVGAEDVLR